MRASSLFYSASYRKTASHFSGRTLAPRARACFPATPLSLFEKDVLARIRLADKKSSCRAIAFNGAAFRVNALYRGDVAQLAISAMGGSFEPEPRNVSRCGACGAG